MSKLKELKQFKKEYSMGHQLFREGELTTDLYILVSGQVTVRKNDIEISVIDKPGSYIGEMSALLNEARAAECICTSTSELLCIPADSLENFFALSPHFGFKLARCLAERLKDMNEKYTDPE